MMILCIFGGVPILSYLSYTLPLINLWLIPIFLSTSFISSRFIFRNLVKTKQSISRLSTTNLQESQSELIRVKDKINIIDNLKEGEFLKASISKSSISGDYVIVRDSNGVVLSQIKISEINKFK